MGIVDRRETKAKWRFKIEKKVFIGKGIYELRKEAEEHEGKMIDKILLFLTMQNNIIPVGTYSRRRNDANVYNVRDIRALQLGIG